MNQNKVNLVSICKLKWIVTEVKNCNIEQIIYSEVFGAFSLSLEALTRVPKLAR